MSFLAPCAWLVLVAVAAPLSGTVVDHEGKPVKGADVWLTAREQIGADVAELAHVVTNDDGAFTIDVRAGEERPGPPLLWAFRPGATVASLSLPNHPRDGASPIRLTLGSPSRVPIRVFGSDGKVVSGAKIRPTGLVWPASLLERLEVTTDAQGHAVLEGVGPGQFYRLDVTAEGLVTQGHDVSGNPTETIVRLFPVGRIAARIVSDEPKALAGWTVTAVSRPEAAGSPGWRTSWVRAQSDESGRVSLRPLAAGLVTFRVVPPEGAPFLPIAPAQVALRGGENVEVKIAVKKAVKVEGSVREHTTGKPAVGVKVNLSRLLAGDRDEDVITDAEGRFSRYVLPGKLRVSLTWFELPDRYYHAPDNTHWADYDLAVGEETHTLAPLEVWPATFVKGVVVDEAGRPVAEVHVHGSAITSKFGDRSIPGSTSTDERGAFVLGRMPPDSTVTVKGSLSYRAESPPVTVRVNADGVQDAPITLRLVRKPSVSLHGRVLGPGGLPVPGADVKIVFRTGMGQNAYGHGKDEQTRTGADGTFRTTDGVPAADEYRVSALAPGMEPAQGDWTKAPAGALPDLVMRPVLRLRDVTGKVIDAEGKAVAGAEVFQSGDGPTRTSDTTDAEGRFTVPGVFNTAAFLFVQKDGFRFTGRRIGAGAEPVELVVSRADGPAAAALKPLPPARTRAEERALARSLVAPLWAQFKPGQREFPGPFETGPVLGLVDTDRVIEMIENQVLRPDERLLAGVALGLFQQSPRDAVATLDAIQPPLSAAEALLDLFDKVADAPADLRRELLDRALARARECNSPIQRVGLIARVADRWFDVGEPEKGTRLLDEARAAFERNSSHATSDLRRDLAQVLARVDLAAALALRDGETDMACLAAMARRVAATDPAAAKRLFARVNQRPIRLNALADVCAGMATRDLPKALEVAGERSPGVAALAVAAAARSKAPTDPAAARALLAEAFDRLERVPPGQIVRPAVAMARLLPVAIELDPGRSPEYLWRAIAARPPRVSGENYWVVSFQTRRYFVVLAQLAALVARYDREAAETIFAPVAAHGPALVDETFDLGNEACAILQAAALFDPRAAVALVDAVPDDPEPQGNSRPGPTVRMKAKARLALARALALPSALCRREALATPGQPDLWPALLDDRPTSPTNGRTPP